MSGTTKLPLSASTALVLEPVITGVGALGVSIVGVLLLILGCGPPI